MVVRIFIMIATSGFLTALECIIFVFGRGSAPLRTLLGGGFQFSSRPSIAGLMGPSSMAEEQGGRGEVEIRTGEERN